MIISELQGFAVTVWLLNQAQENVIPVPKFDGILMGVDQGAYIISVDSGKNNEFILLPIGSCRIHARKK
ncbi:MAG: hypothetical protein ACYDAO_00860 [Thermoplasmataceae archaeon]